MLSITRRMKLRPAGPPFVFIHNMLITKWINHKILFQNLLTYGKPYDIIHHVRR